MSNANELKIPWWMWLLFIFIALMVLGRCSDGSSNKGGAKNSEVTDCALRGIKYFESIGSYPTLSDGRDAVVVAKDRCSRTTTAF